MSWFDTLKNVAKEVVSNAIRPITPGDLGLGISTAVPTDRDGYWSSLSVPSSSGHVAVDTTDESESDNERQAEASHSESTPQVTTRARYTYELDRFQKNALLMFVQNRSDVSAGSRVEKSTTQDLNAILDTFTGFRFKITTHIDLTCGEIDNKCQEFFQQDFQEYGAIVVVVLTFEGTTGQLSAIDGRFSESVIMRHLTNDLNPTLLAKPRIYITETNRTVSPENGVGYSVPLDEHPDVLCLHFPTIDYGNMSDRPFLILCRHINQMADSRDFVDILEKSVEDIQLKIVTNRTVSPENGVGYSVPLDEHPDVLCLHFPTIDYGNMSDRPFLILCRHINQMADSRDFVDILEKSVEDIQLKIVTNRTVSPENGVGYSVPLDEHPDVLCLHFPTIDYGNMSDRPFLILCRHINQMADSRDFVDILEKSVEDIQLKIVVSLRIEDKPVELNHNFTKDMMLARSTNRTVSPENGVGYSVPLDEHPDVLCLHFPTIDYGNMSDRPFLILCRHINQMADSRDFVDILEKSVEDIQLKIVVSLRIEDKPVELNHNFTKDMMLARSVS